MILIELGNLNSEVQGFCIRYVAWFSIKLCKNKIKMLKQAFAIAKSGRSYDENFVSILN